MKKRAKLDLSVDVAESKRHVNGFESEEPVGTPAAASSPQWRHARGSAPSAGRARPKSQVTKRKRSSRLPVITTVVVATAVALVALALRRP